METNMNKKNFKLSGSITVESAIILPILFIIFATILLFSFYLHDKIAFNSATYRSLLNSSVSVKNDIDSDIPDEDELISYLYPFTFLHIPTQISISSDSNSLSAIVTISNASTLHMVSNFLHCEKIRYFSVLFDFITN